MLYINPLPVAPGREGTGPAADKREARVAAPEPVLSITVPRLLAWVEGRCGPSSPR